MIQAQSEKTAQKQKSQFSLRELDRVQLSGQNQGLLESALREASGDAAWRARKQAEARDLLGLSEIAPPGRLTVAWLDLREDLRALLLMNVPVPCRPDSNNRLRVATHAVLGFTYRAEVVRQPQPGHVFFQILRPYEVWLPDVRQPDQALSVAGLVPAGTPAKSLIVMAYGALSMQSLQLDFGDPTGVFNVVVARWWEQNAARYVPLSDTPFLKQDGR